MIILFAFLFVLYVFIALLIWAMSQPGALGTDPNGKPAPLWMSVFWPIWMLQEIFGRK